MKTSKNLLFLTFVLFLLPMITFGQHTAESTPTTSHEEPALIFEILEWIEFTVDLFGIGILIIGFAKGLFHFLKLEYDSMTGKNTFDDILALRSVIGWYIILSLDFLIISDIIHSVISPQFNELINLGIIVILRTSIGFFLGRELMELRHHKKEEVEFEEFIHEHKPKEEHKH